MKDNSKLLSVLLIGAAVGAALALLASSEKGKEIVSDIKDAAGKAEEDIKKAVENFEKKVSKGKEYAGNFEKKAGSFFKKYTN